MAGLNASVEIDMAELQRSTREYARRLGMVNRETLGRLAVQTSKELAVKTDPRGGTSHTRKALEERIRSGLENVIVLVRKKVDFNRIRKTPLARRRLRDYRDKVEWFTPQDHQFCEDLNRLWNHVEKWRTARGHTRRISAGFKLVIPGPLYKKILSRRNRMGLAGIAKGGWLGAGLAIQDHEAWTGKRPLGKNFMGWAQKHRKMGRGFITESEGRVRAHLVNKAWHSRRLLDRNAESQAAAEAWQAVEKDFRFRLRELNKIRSGVRKAA